MWAGIAQFLGGIGFLLSKLPIQGRKERWRNQIEYLDKRRAYLLSSVCTEAKAREVIEINAKIDVLNQKLKNIDKE